MQRVGVKPVAALAGLVMVAAGWAAVSCQPSDGGPEGLRWAEPVAEVEHRDGTIVEVHQTGRHLVVSFLEELVYGVAVIDVESGKRWTQSNLSSGVWLAGDSLVMRESGSGATQVRDLAGGEVSRRIAPKEADVKPLQLHQVTESTVYMGGLVGSEATLWAFDVETGETRWKHSSDRAFGLTAAVPSEKPVVETLNDDYEAHTLHRAARSPLVYTLESDDKRARVLDEKTGDELWTVDVPFAEEGFSLVRAEDEHTVILPETAPDSCEREFLTVDADGRSRNINAYGAYQGDDGWKCPRSTSATIEVTGGFVYAQDDRYRPRLTDVTTAEPAWTAKEKGEPLLGGEGVALYRATEGKTNRVVAADVKSGQKLWSPDTNEFPELTIGNGQLLNGDGQETVAADLRTGEQQWRRQGSVVGQGEGSYVFLHGDKLAVVNADGR